MSSFLPMGVTFERVLLPVKLTAGQIKPVWLGVVRFQ